jgi:hypothetical protein
VLAVVAVEQAEAVVAAEAPLKPVRNLQRPVCLSSLWMASPLSHQRQRLRPGLLPQLAVRLPAVVKAVEAVAALELVLAVDGVVQVAAEPEAAPRLCQPSGPPDVAACW